MSMTTSSMASYNLGNLNLCTRNRSHAPVLTPNRLPRIPSSKYGYCFSVNQGFQWFNINRRGQAKRTMKMELKAIDNLQPGAPLPSEPPFSGWSHWIFWTIIPMVLPFFKSKWGPLLTFKKQVDTAMETVESVAEAVEDVAEKVDQLTDEMLEKLPDGSKLKDAICMVDNLAEEVIKTADFAEDLINKVEKLEDKVETFLEKSSADEQKVASPKSR